MRRRELPGATHWVLQEQQVFLEGKGNRCPRWSDQHEQRPGRLGVGGDVVVVHFHSPYQDCQAAIRGCSWSATPFWSWTQPKVRLTQKEGVLVLLCTQQSSLSLGTGNGQAQDS